MYGKSSVFGLFILKMALLQAAPLSRKTGRGERPGSAEGRRDPAAAARGITAWPEAVRHWLEARICSDPPLPKMKGWR